MSYKDKLITSGFPRSGNMFLNYALSEMYFPDEEPQNPEHFVYKLEQNDNVIIPLRSPADCIYSWHNFKIQKEISLDPDFIFYKRFNSYVLDNLNRHIVLDFNIFTKDLSYISNKIGIDPINICTVDDVKNRMIKDNNQWNLPRDDYNFNKATKQEVLDNPLFEECMGIYNSILNEISK
jgi:hypothetical protein